MPSHHRSRRIRAMRSEEPGDAIAARAEALRPFLGRSAEERARALRRLLRAERRAAHTGLGYDAVRHAALRRLLGEPAGTGSATPACAGAKIPAREAIPARMKKAATGGGGLRDR